MMKLYINLVHSVHLIILFSLFQLQCSLARTVATSKTLKINSMTEEQQNATTVDNFDNQRNNHTAVTTLPAQTQSGESSESQESAGNMLTHILRKKRETEANMPLDFNTMHLPCDLDQRGRADIIESYPNHCVWAWNNRFVHEGFYRVYKTYQLEGFFFGQYYERLKRFEIDPHTWDYAGTGV